MGAVLIYFCDAFPQSGSPPDVRGLFLKSRPQASPARSKAAKKSGESSDSNKGKAAKPDTALGLGVTLFVAEGERLLRAHPDRVFRAGERVRLLVETSRASYLYVFHQEGEGPATMLFPDARVAGGSNRTIAHQPLDVPDGAWFVFDENPGKERLTLVVSERPLKGVPHGEALDPLRAFTLPEDAFAKLVRGAQSVVSHTGSDEGAAMVPAEGARGLRLTGADPPPSRVVMKKTPAAKAGDWILCQLTLTHQ